MTNPEYIPFTGELDATPEYEPFTGKLDGEEKDGAFVRGLKRAKQSATITTQLATGDTAGTANTIRDAELYNRQNPSSKESDELSAAWEKGDGITGGIAAVGQEFAKDWRESKGFIGGLRETGKNVNALREGIVSQLGNSVAPMVGLAAGATAGAAAGTAVPLVGNIAGGLAGGWAGAAAGNTLVEGGGQLQTALQKAGIDPMDTVAVEKFVAENGNQILGQSAIKGGIIGAVDTATAGIAGRILNVPARAAVNRALVDMGVDVADKIAVKQAMKNSGAEIASRLASDTAYQASTKGAENLARNAGAAALDPAGEFTGEFVGQGAATGDWNTKDAALEALSSVGQSGAMFAGQKAYQAATNPFRNGKPDPSIGGAAQATPPIDPAGGGQGGGAFPQLPAPTINVNSQGVAETAEDRNDRLNRIASGGINDVTPISAAADADIRGFTPAARQAQALEAPTITVDGNGQALTAQDRNNRLSDRLSGGVTDVTPIQRAPEVIPPSRAMGLNPANGSLSGAAAMAVDSGASVFGSISQQGALNGQQTQEAQQTGEGQSQGGGATGGAAPKTRAVKTLSGETVIVNESDLTSGAKSLRTFTSDGKPRAARLDAATIAPPPPKVVLQNRDRSTSASIQQMNNIVAKPDFLKAGTSSTMDRGAPMVFGDLPDKLIVGRTQQVADDNGKRIPTNYAVVEADDLVASNHFDGTTNNDYANGVDGKLRAVAGNGRVAGLQEAWNRGTTGEYAADLAQEAENLGIDPQALAGFSRPVLVRVMDEADVTADIGDRSNIQAGLQLSALEKATNDTRRMDLRDMEFDDNGDPTADTMRSFVATMPVQERGDMLDSRGLPTVQLIDRIKAAAFKQAYMNDALVELATQAVNEDAKRVISALAMAAGDMVQLDGTGEFDIRQAVADAAGLAINAAKKREKLADYLKTRQVDESAEAIAVARFFAENSTSANQIADGLRAWAELAKSQVEAAKANAEQSSMFGDTPTLSRNQLFERLSDENITEIEREQLIAKQERAKSIEQSADAESAERAGDADSAPDSEGSSEEIETESFALDQQTPQELQALEEEQAALQQELEQEQRDAEAADRAKQTRDEVTRRSEAAADNFQLGQSAEDSLSGQGDIFAAPQETTTQTEQAAPVETAKPQNLKDAITAVREKKSKAKGNTTKKADAESNTAAIDKTNDALLYYATVRRLSAAYKKEEYKGSIGDYATLRAELEARAANKEDPKGRLAQDVLDHFDDVLANAAQRAEQNAIASTTNKEFSEEETASKDGKNLPANKGNERPAKWRSDKIHATIVAKSLGIKIPKNTNTADLVRLIDAQDAKASGNDTAQDEQRTDKQADSGFEYRTQGAVDAEASLENKGERVQTYVKGDKAEYTGETEVVAGQTFYQVKMLEGVDEGKTKVVASPPDGDKTATVKKTTSPPVTPQIATPPQLKSMIGIAADSIEKLRKQDVERVLSEAPAPFLQSLAAHIRDKRKDLVDEVAEVMQEVNAKTAPTPTETAPKPEAAPAPTAKKTAAKKPDADKTRAKADLMNALADLGDILGKGNKLFIVPEQEQKLLPVLARVLDAAFRLGYHKFKDASKFALDQMRKHLGDEAADALTIDHLQGAYIAMAGGKKGVDTKRAVIDVETKAEIESHEAVAVDDSGSDNAEDTDTSNQGDDQNVPSANDDLERDSGIAATEPAVGKTVQDDGGATSSGDREAGGRATKADGGEQQNTTGVSTGSATTARDDSDKPVHTREPDAELESITDGAEFSERGSDIGIEGVPPDNIPATTVEESADTPATGLKAGIEQGRANKSAFKQADIESVKKTLPQLLPGQQEDVLKAEQRFSKPTGYGMLFTNGTGTGKTFTGLGIVKRFALNGKTNTLIVVPDDKIASDWIESAKVLGLNVTALEDTKDAGKGIVITSYANLGANNAVATREWDLVVADEAHSLIQNQEGDSTAALKNLRAITNHHYGAVQKHAMLYHEDFAAIEGIQAKMKSASDILRNTSTPDLEAEKAKKTLAKLDEELYALQRKFAATRAEVSAAVKAKQGEARTRLVALSATPFAYEKTVDWANGYLFDYRDGYPYQDDGMDYNKPNPMQYFMQKNFGYSMRHNKLTQPDAAVDRGMMQRNFNRELKKSGALSGRMLDVKYDYDRRFVLVNSAIGERIDEALQWLSDRQSEEKKGERGYRHLNEAINARFKYLQKRYLLEAIKATEAVPIVKEHLKLGRKVVVFHDYKKGGGFNPFIVEKPAGLEDGWTLSDEEMGQFTGALAEFNSKFKDLINSDLADMDSPIEVFTRELPGVLLINGDQKKSDLLKRYKSFQSDDSGPQVMLVQSAKNKGWSGHDTTGKHQRVLINLGQPTAPTLAIQQEGRIYRTGQASDAIMRYLNTGTNWERWTFASTIAGRASTAENLGMGEMARALKDSFIQSFEESDTFTPGHDGEGKGGKERDAHSNNALSEYDRAKTLYFSSEKKTSKTKAAEGVDYFATPEPVGLKMVQWLDSRPEDNVLEPSAGHGAIARWFPENLNRTVIEPSFVLRSRLAMVMGKENDVMHEKGFEDLSVVNKYSGIVMNPPFGVGGKTAIEHLAKAATHLKAGGRIVAIIPTGPAADKRFDQWLLEESQRPARPIYKDARLGQIYDGDVLINGSGFKFVVGKVTTHSNGTVTARPAGTAPETGMPLAQINRVIPGPRIEQFKAGDGLNIVANIKLPTTTFNRAGTAVMTRIVVIDKVVSAGAVNAKETQEMDFTDLDSIKDLFDTLEDIDLPKREIAEEAPTEAEAKKKSAPAKKTKESSGTKAVAGGSVVLNGQTYEISTYTTNAGKELVGAWVATESIAEKFGRGTFQKRPLGWFVREKNFPVGSVQNSEAKEDGAGDAAMFSRSKPTVRPVQKALIDAYAEMDGDFSGDEKEATARYEKASDNLASAQAALEADLAAVPNEGFAIRANSFGGKQIVLTKSAKGDGWQLTRLDQNGEPWGDTAFKTKSQAIKYFIEEADLATIETSREVDSIDFRRNDKNDKAAAQENARRHESAKRLVGKLTAKWAKVPEIVIARNMSDSAIPNEVREHDAKLKSQGAIGEPQGFIYKGKVYLLSDQLATGKEVTETLFHEVLGHFGLRSVFGADLKKILSQVTLMRRKDVIAKAREYGLFDSESLGSKNAKAMSDAQVFAAMSQENKETAAEEVLAEMAQANPELGLVKQAIAAIRNWLRQNVAVFGNLQLTDADIIQAYILPAKGFVERGKDGVSVVGNISFSRSNADQTETPEFKKWFGDSKVVDANGKPLVMYHGTRKDFNTFSTEANSTAARAYYVSPSAKLAGQFADSIDFDNEAETDAPVVMPVFVSASNPFDFENQAHIEALAKYEEKNRYTEDSISSDLEQVKWGSWSALENRWTQKALQTLGFDSFYTQEYGEKNLGLYKPNQVKSAIGNNGDFSTENDDIAFFGAAEEGAGTWQAPEATKFDQYTYLLQDKQIDSKRVVNAIKENGKQIADDLDVYLQETLFHGRAAKRVKDFAEQEELPLIELLRDKGLELAELEEYLHARHAPEANAEMSERNPNKAMIEERLKKAVENIAAVEVSLRRAPTDKNIRKEMLDAEAELSKWRNAKPYKGEESDRLALSGMSNEEAAAVMDSLDATKRKNLQAAAKMVDRIIAKTRETIVDYGLESDDTVDAWSRSWNHYVPLMREQLDDVVMGGMGTGQGFSIKGKETKGRTGSTKKVVDILANINMQRERAIVRGEKNRVATALLGLVKDNPNKDFWRIAESGEIPSTQTIDKKTGLVITQIDPLFKSRDNALVVKVNGVEKVILFNEDNPRAMRMAVALKNMDAANLEGLLGNVASVTRYLAAVNTQYNPIFGVVNMVRDFQEAAINMQATPLAGKQKQVLGNAPKAIWQIGMELRAQRKGEKTGSEYGSLWEEFQEQGGQTGYRDMFNNSAERSKQLQNLLKPDAWADTKAGRFFTANGALKVPLEILRKTALRPLLDLLSDYNEAIENGVRLSAYKAALDIGMSKPRAAELAKNLTVNFNRKGQVAQQVGALYAFFNASVQGTARMGQTLFDMEPGQPKTLRLSSLGKKILGGGILLGSAQAVTLAAAGFGDDEPPEFIRQRNLIIPNPFSEKGYTSIPMPLGYHVLTNLGRIPTEYALSGFKNGGKRAVGMVDVLADIYNPLGGSGLSLQTIAPSVIDPFAALAENKDFSGRPIAKQSFNKITPGHALGRDTSSLMAQGMSKIINYATGGTEFTRGEVSPTPDQIDYLIGQATGGVGREASKASQSVQALATGQDLPWHKIPLVGRFYGDADSVSAKQSSYYNIMDGVRRHAAEVKGLRNEGRIAEAQAYIQENPEAVMHIAANAAERQVKKLRDRMDDLKEQDAPRESIKELEDQMVSVMQRFDALVKSKQKP